MLEQIFNNVSDAEKDEAIESIVQHASPRYDFFLMLLLAVSMAVFGVLLGSTVILIGSMLIAPLLYPLLSLSLGIIASDEALIGRSISTIGKSVALSLLAGFCIGLLFNGASAAGGAPLGIVVGGSASLMYALVASIAGFAAAFAVTKPRLNETLSGTAIAVALVPPLAVAGIGLSLFDWAMVSNAFLLFMVNVIGIMFSAMIVFALFRFSVKKRVTREAVKEEDREIKKESHATEG